MGEKRTVRRTLLNNDRVSVQHENEGQNSGPERSCTELSDAKNGRDLPFSPARDDAERITAFDVMVDISKQYAKSSHGIKNRGYYDKMWSKHEKEE
jgi:hypothetical protein